MLSELFLFIVTSSLFLCMWELYSVTLLVLFVSLLLYHLTFSTNSPPWFSLVGFYVDGLPLFSALSPSQYRLAALFSVLSLSFHVIFPVYLLSNFNLLRSRILFFLFIGWGPLSWYLQQQTCFYNVEIKGVSKTLIVLVVRAKWYGFSLVFKDVITAVCSCFH